MRRSRTYTYTEPRDVVLNTLKEGKIESIKRRLEAGCETLQELRPLAIYAACGDPRGHSLIPFLVENGFPVSPETGADGKHNRSALHYLAINTSDELYTTKSGRRRWVKAYDALISAGNMLDAVDCFGMTPMMAAVDSGRLAIAEFLMSEGATLDKNYNDGSSMLGHLYCAADWKDTSHEQRINHPLVMALTSEGRAPNDQDILMQKEDENNTLYNDFLRIMSSRSAEKLVLMTATFTRRTIFERLKKSAPQPRERRGI